MAPEQAARLDLSGQYAAGSTVISQAQTTGAAPAIPDYELLRRVGRGAYGEVWLARNLTGSFVAVKVVARAAFEHDRPFEREFEGIKSFEPISRSDPAEVAVLHVGRGDGFFYYVMELADDVNVDAGYSVLEPGPQQAVSGHPGPVSDSGRSPSVQEPLLSICHPASSIRKPESYCPHTLREDLKRHGRLPVAQCVQIGLALTRALTHLHKCGLVHRDVKPSNVIFVGGVPKLADIGLVTSVDATRSMVGTEGYVAPEGPGTPQADLYSLGKMLYEMSTGCDRKEFPTLPPDVATLPDRDAIVELNAIVMRASQFDPSQRYANAEAMLRELALIQAGKSVKRKRTQHWYWAAGKRAGLGLGAFAALAAAVTILVPRIVPSDSYPEGPPSTNMDANGLCEKAMLIIRGDNYPQFAQAYTNLLRAIELDGRFARPYVFLQELRGREEVPGLGPMSTDELQHIADKLRELAPKTAAAYCAQSGISFGNWDFPQAEALSLQAIKADPRYEMGHTAYAYLLTMWGRPAEGRAQLEISRSLKPSKVTVYRMLGHTYYAQRDYTNAIAWYRTTLGWESHHSIAYRCIGRCYLAMGDYANAITNFEAADLLTTTNEPETRRYYDDRRRAFKQAGPREYWEIEWGHTQNDSNATFYEKAIIQIHLGDTNAALNWLNKSYETHEHWPGEFQTPLEYLLYEHYWDGLHDDPRFRQLLDKVGFTKVMASRKR